MADSSETPKLFHRVVLINAGNDRPEVVRTIMLLTGMDFEKAVKITAMQPVSNVVLETDDPDAAQIAHSLLVKAGAEVEIHENTDISDQSPEIAQPRYAVVLINPGDHIIQVIKAVRDITHLDLKEVKDLVESAPGSIILQTDDLNAATGAANAISASEADSEIVDRESGESRIVMSVPRQLPSNTPSGTYRVNIMDAGSEKRRLVSSLRMQASQAYEDAQRIVDREMPSMAVDGVDRLSALNIAKSLASAGARVEIIDTNSFQRTEILPTVPSPEPVPISTASAPDRVDWKERIKKWFFSHPNA